jgi:hypothetical protein
MLGVDIIADDTKPDFQRASVKASTVINSKCANVIDDPGLEYLSDKQQFLVKKATVYLVEHYLNTGDLDANRGKIAYAGAGQSFTFSNPKRRPVLDLRPSVLGARAEETTFIPQIVLMILEDANLLDQVYAFDPIKESRDAKKKDPNQEDKH